jgi:hypothetical protein
VLLMDRILRFNSNLGENIEVYAARLDAALVALGGVSLVDFTFTMKKQGVYQATVVYRPGSFHGRVIRAIGFQRQGSPDASQQAADAFLQANPTFRGVFLRSISPQDTHDLSARQLMLLYSTGPLVQLPTGEPLPAVLVPVVDIAADGVGLANVLDGTGAVIGQVTAQNRSTNVWLAGTTASAYYDTEAGVWFAYPDCCI